MTNGRAGIGDQRETIPHASSLQQKIPRLKQMRRITCSSHWGILLAQARAEVYFSCVAIEPMWTSTTRESCRFDPGPAGQIQPVRRSGGIKTQGENYALSVLGLATGAPPYAAGPIAPSSGLPEKESTTNCGG